MSVGTLASLEFKRYFPLLRDVFPAQADFCICDEAANVIDLDGRQQIIFTTDGDSLINPESLHVCQDVRELSVFEENHIVYFSMAICTPTDVRIGTLMAVMDADQLTGDERFHKRVKRSLSPIVSCMEKEYRLTLELDAMALELAGRYEELNLVYDNDDEYALGKDTDSFNKIVEDYVSYLGLIWLP